MAPASSDTELFSDTLPTDPLEFGLALQKMALNPLKAVFANEVSAFKQLADAQRAAGATITEQDLWQDPYREQVDRIWMAAEAIYEKVQAPNMNSSLKDRKAVVALLKRKDLRPEEAADYLLKTYRNESFDIIRKQLRQHKDNQKIARSIKNADYADPAEPVYQAEDEAQLLEAKNAIKDGLQRLTIGGLHGLLAYLDTDSNHNTVTRKRKQRGVDALQKVLQEGEKDFSGLPTRYLSAIPAEFLKSAIAEAIGNKSPQEMATYEKKAMTPAARKAKKAEEEEAGKSNQYAGPHKRRAETPAADWASAVSDKGERYLGK